jgi:L-aminopeptidase/D-esterase-like protein
MQNQPIRARDLGIPFDGSPGAYNAITDVSGVLVGHKTLVSGEGALKVGQGPVRTGVTVVLPRGFTYDPVFAGCYALNGNGEMTGTTWVEESGFLEGPIGVTNTHSVGVVRDAIVRWQHEHGMYDAIAPGVYWIMPVVAETYDGFLNDVNGQHVKLEHVDESIAGARGGAVEEGAVGGGTGMVCHQYKGGIGTASRRIEIEGQTYTVGVLVQANYGKRSQLTIAGVPVGRTLTDQMPQPGAPPTGAGSIIVIVATDAPLLSHQARRLARRAALGIGRVGGIGENGSGDIFIAFSTANPGAARRHGIAALAMLPNDQMSPLFDATIQATEESIVNALVAGRTTVGINGNTVYGMPHDRVRDLLKQYGRL